MLTCLVSEQRQGLFSIALGDVVVGAVHLSSNLVDGAVLQLDEGLEDGVPRLLDAFPEFAKPLARHVWLCRLKVDEALGEGLLAVQNEAGQSVFFTMVS